jgi:hypothetical protein
MVGEGIGQAELGGEPGAGGRRAEQPQRRGVAPDDGNRRDPSVLGRVEVRAELVELPAKGLRGAFSLGTDGVDRRSRPARGAADAEGIRPGWSTASVPNCSATTIGAWLGSSTPPAPTRMCRVAFARWPTRTAGAELATLRMP